MQQKQQKQQQLRQQPQQLQGHSGNFFEKLWPHVARPHLAFSNFSRILISKQLAFTETATATKTYSMRVESAVTFPSKNVTAQTMIVMVAWMRL